MMLALNSWKGIDGAHIGQAIPSAHILRALSLSTSTSKMRQQVSHASHRQPRFGF